MMRGTPRACGRGSVARRSGENQSILYQSATAVKQATTKTSVASPRSIGFSCVFRLADLGWTQLGYSTSSCQFDRA